MVERFVRVPQPSKRSLVRGFVKRRDLALRHRPLPQPHLVWGLGFLFWFRISGFGFQVRDFDTARSQSLIEFGAWGRGFGVWGLGFGVWGLEFGISGASSGSLRCARLGSRGRLAELGIRGWGLGFRVFRVDPSDVYPDVQGFGVWISTLVFRLGV